MGPHSQVASQALSGLAGVVIDSRGDINAIESYIESGDFLQDLAPTVGDKITAAFGGKESLKAALLGNITEIILASNGDPALIEQNIGCLLYTSPSPRDGLLSRMPSSA